MVPEKLPAADMADVNMNEIGCRAVADATAGKRQSGVAEMRRLHPGHPNIDGLGFHMQGVQMI
jgi:hypothetical protein